MKVWGIGNYYKDGDHHRAVAYTKSKKRAAELFNVSMYTFNNYAAVTANKEEVKAAMAQPDTVVIMRKIY